MVKINKTLIIGINLGDYGSTGSIMRNSLEYAHEKGNFDYLIFIPKDEGKPNTFVYGYKFFLLKRIFYHHLLKVHLTMPDGLFYFEYSRRIIKKIKKCYKQYANIIVNLHNIHMAGIYYPSLFKYLSKTKINVIYTMHDAWAFTGGCYFYKYCNCSQWMNGCKCKCCQHYDTKLFAVKRNFRLKQKYTTRLAKNQLLLVPVSHWLSLEIKKSFLKKYPCIVNHGECSIVPLNKPDIDLKKNLGLVNKKIVITVSAYWNDWKGYKYLYQIADKLPKDYVLLIIGGCFETKEYNNIVHINEVPNQELVKFYSISDVYASVTQDEALGLTLCEAQICGCPVVSFGHGGSKETIEDGISGYVVGEDNNIDKMVSAIIHVVEDKPFKKEDIIKSGNRFKKYEHAKRMLDIYNEKANKTFN